MDQKPDFHYVALVGVRSEETFKRLQARFEALFAEGNRYVCNCILNADTMFATFKASSETPLDWRPMQTFTSETWDDKDAGVVFSHANCPDSQPMQIQAPEGWELVPMGQTPSCLFAIAGMAPKLPWWKDLFGKKAAKAAESAFNQFGTIMDQEHRTTQGVGHVRGSGAHLNGSIVTTHVECDQAVAEEMKAKLLANFDKYGITLLGVINS